MDRKLTFLTMGALFLSTLMTVRGRVHSPECVIKHELRTSCGFGLVTTREECNAMDCCWDEYSQVRLRCYQKNYACSVPPTRRRQCGDVINDGDCVEMGCCWDGVSSDLERPARCFQNVYNS